MTRFVALLLVLFCGAPALAADQWLQLKPLPLLERPDPARVELGKALFFDRRLSGDGTVSCAVCHIPDEAFADGRKISGAYPTNKHWRNTQGLLNVAYLEVFFWDGRSRSLQNQARGPIHSSFEMNLNPRFLVAKLREIPQYRQLFQQAWGGEVTEDRIVGSLTAFQQTLLATNSPFDRYLGGDKTALTEAGLRGAEIFFGSRGGCSQCHSGSLLTDQQYHNLGIAEPGELVSDPQHRTTRNFFLDEMGLPPMDRDPGYYAISRHAKDLGAFRTPPLRQVEQTAPYMHNGSIASLAEVIDYFDRGGDADPNKSALLKPLQLSAGEKQDLEVFLRSLTATYEPVRAPRPPGY